VSLVESEESRRMIAALEMSGNYRVLSRFAAPDCYGTFAADVRMRRVAVVDTETTGLDKVKDKVFELGYVIVEFDPLSGRFGQVLSRYNGTEDPGFPLSEDVKELTGKTEEMLAGTEFDDELINDEIGQVDLVVAHNSGFDRRFLEKRFPIFEGKWFACSMKEVDWKQFGSTSQKLEFLAIVVCKMFYEAHRALVDAEVTTHLLSQVGKDGRSALAQLLENSKKKTFRVWANDAPIEKKDILKSDGFWWNDGSDPRRPVKAWIKETRDLAATIALLSERVYTRAVVVTVEHVTGKERYTDRASEVQKMRLAPSTTAIHAPAPAPTPEESEPVCAVSNHRAVHALGAQAANASITSRGAVPAMAEAVDDDWDLPI
jgi:DNA polymerase III subunit epsilon